jgi:hypothetical protein
MTAGGPLWANESSGGADLLGVVLGDDWVFNGLTDTGTAFVVGRSGTILFTMDGITWQQMSDPNVTDDLVSISLTGSVAQKSATVWILSASGTVIWTKQNANGAWGQWTEQAPPEGLDQYTLFSALSAVTDGSGTATLWAGTYGDLSNTSTVWKLTVENGKGTWSANCPSAGCQQDYLVSVSSLAAIDSNTAWMVSDSGILKTVTGGQ